MNTSSHASKFFIDYASEPVTQWPSLISEAKRRGSDTLTTHIFWGVHETAPRIRDFSRASNKSLEKFLRLAVDQGMGIEAKFGFSAHEKTFPSWIYGLKKSALVPYSLSKVGQEDFGFVPLPSFSEPGFQESYLDFLAEAFALLGLYRDSGRGLQKIQLDFGLYETDVTLLVRRRLPTLLQSRYTDVSAFNKVYETSFRDFSPLESEKSIQLLLDRRPWMACFDYRWCRAQILLEFWKKAWTLADELGLSDILSSSLSELSPVAPTSAAWGIACDSVYLDSVSGESFPFCPEGIAHPSALLTYRVWESMRASAMEANLPAQLLPLWDGEARLSPTLSAVFCGKYLTRAAFSVLKRHLQEGKDLFFPFGAAQFDEKLDCVDWGMRFEPTDDLPPQLVKWKSGTGTIWQPRQPLAVDDALWSNTLLCIDKIRQKGGLH